MPADQIIRDLGDSLVLRYASMDDTEALAAFNSRIHSDAGPDKPDERVGAWTRDLMAGQHPLFRPEDFTVVENTQTRQIVSTLNLISQTWAYAGIPFGVGRPELVGTLPEYRGRGLVRAQFEVIHRWSKERGELVQAITGIPFYYRQFGYEMCVNLEGGRMGFAPNVPALEEGQAEIFTLRPAAAEDIPFIQDVYDLGRRRSLLSAVWTEDLWRHELLEKSEKNINRMELRVIENQGGEPIGFLGHPGIVWGPTQMAVSYELKAGTSWWTVTPAVLRYLWNTGQAHAARDGGVCGAFGFWLGEAHPAYQAVANRLPRVRQPYAYYLRVADLSGFLCHVAPVLEARLASSICVGYSGDVKINFYRGGLWMKFVDGRLESCAAWQSSQDDHPVAAFPGLTFLHLLFGYRTVEEIRYMFPDCWVNEDKAGPLLDALFPKQASNILVIS